MKYILLLHGKQQQSCNGTKIQFDFHIGKPQGIVSQQ